MKQEFRLLKGIIRDYTPSTYSYEPTEGSRKAKQADYDMVAVIPVSDPNAATMAQKIVQYQAVLQLAQTAPQIYDMPYLHRQMLDVLGITNAEKLVPLKDGDDMKPRDPISENMDVINGKPVKAFIYQDHEAHIAVHTGMAAMQAHMQEHLAFSYRKQIEEQAGVALPPPDAEMSEDIELQVSRLAASAAQQLSQKKQAEAQQQQNQEAAQDPLVQMQMQELQIKQGELDLKKQKLMIDAAEKNDRLELELERIEAQKEIAGLQVGAKLATSRGDLDAKQEAEGLRIGMEIVRDQMNMTQQQKEATSASPTTQKESE
jgi:post-segregation antitoxin (ccd killing protein)